MRAVALTVAGSDPSGGAGIQADLKTFHQFGVYGEAVISLITVQNTAALTGVHVLEPTLVVAQLDAVMEDTPSRSGQDRGVGERRGNGSSRQLPARLEVDPSGGPRHAVQAWLAAHGTGRGSCSARETVASGDAGDPNISEAEMLAGIAIQTAADMEQAAHLIRGLGVRAVLIKGGHLAGEPSDLLYTRSGFRWFAGRRVATRHTHGTGCVFSAAITAALAQGDGMENAVARAKQFVQTAIATAPGLGSGQGPLNHFAPVA